MPSLAGAGFRAESGKVASNGRVMPCLQAVLVHTGVGVPMYMETFSGRAGLLEHTESILDNLERLIGAEVSRIVVIDAEADSAPFLKRLQDNHRPWVTVLKGNILKGKEVKNRHGDWAYRDGDRLTEGVIDLSLGDDGIYQVRVVEVKHRGTGEVTTLGTCLPEDLYPAERVAKFGRVPAQDPDREPVEAPASGIQRGIWLEDIVQDLAQDQQTPGAADPSRHEHTTTQKAFTLARQAVGDPDVRELRVPRLRPPVRRPVDGALPALRRHGPLPALQ